jgi:putative transposase
MTTDSKKSLSPSPSFPTAEIEKALQSGLGDFTLRELLGTLVSSAGLAERQVYLDHAKGDKPNGFYDRSLQIGTVPVDVRAPRTRTGDFRPASLPSPYQRGYSEEIQSLLLGLLGSSRSVNAAMDALRKMGLSRSEQDLERVASGLIEELELRNSRPVDPDMLAVFVDGKYVELRESDKLRSACIYLVVGLGRDGRKRMLSC